MNPPSRSLRKPIAEVLARLAAGEAIRFLDARGDKPAPGADLQIPGAIRFHALVPRIDPAWERGRLTIVYCA